ncbi:kynurenine 3-monooxygenase [Lasiosphaeris hirsuta]|uniref:Kynurenine 3-monooxygenase n=1 Tax=Lasiosphaeris hirsuta TaxID=260670 RepID=A0AA40B058_9PEZI|nr:kynurenine 3-monooxygenase [Lasiosphaeris hirsuta]
MDQKQKIIVVGAGPVGSLAALYAANRGYNVEIYELRSDLRDPSTTPLNFTRSINLALSERGINAMRHAGQPKLIDHVMGATIPMRGRMLHLRKRNGSLAEESQDYDAHGRSILAIDRGGLNKRLLDILEEMPNVKFLFNHKLTRADLEKKRAWFHVREADTLIEVDFDLMIGADGAHSAVRQQMMKFTRMDYSQQYIDTLWCEFQIQPREIGPGTDPNSKFRISANHLHIWPGRNFMFIAIPSEDGSFTCTLFAPPAVFAELEADLEGSQLVEFFDKYFPGVTSHIPPPELIASFRQNPHLPLINIKCKPHHFSSSAVIVGDAAHAMVPFYGQGMNAGLEDVRILFETLDKYAAEEAGATPASRRALALNEYTAARTPDAFAINDLALQNYVEMRASVLSTTYRLRKAIEEALSVYVPWLGWQTKYSRVSFGNEPYSVVVTKSEYQAVLITRFSALATLLAAGYLARPLWRLLFSVVVRVWGKMP